MRQLYEATGWCCAQIPPRSPLLCVLPPLQTMIPPSPSPPLAFQDGSLTPCTPPAPMASCAPPSSVSQARSTLEGVVGARWARWRSTSWPQRPTPRQAVRVLAVHMAPAEEETTETYCIIRPPPLSHQVERHSLLKILMPAATWPGRLLGGLVRERALSPSWHATGCHPHCACRSEQLVPHPPPPPHTHIFALVMVLSKPPPSTHPPSASQVAISSFIRNNGV